MIELLAGIGAMSGLLCLLLAVFLVVSKGRLARANRYLGVFLFLTAIDIGGLFGLVLPVSVGEALAFRTVLAFLQMPVFYAYVVTLCLPERAFVRHFIGGALLALVALLDMLFRTDGVFPVWGQAGLHVQFYVYLALSALALVRFRSGLAQTRSTDQTVQLRWLWAVLVTSFTAHGLVFTRTIAGWLDWPVSWASLQLASGFLALAILCGLTLTALLRPGLFQSLEPSEAASLAGPKPGLPNTALDHLAERAQAYLEAHRSFLEPELTLKALARRLGVGERDLSQALNQSLGLHFFDFINRARIEHAKALITQDDARPQTLLETAYASGFNSKSSFNTAFKKHTGLTPSAFRAKGRGD